MIIRCLVWVLLVLVVGACVATPGSKDLPHIAYPSAPVGRAHETVYTQELREKLRSDARESAEGRVRPAVEPIGETVQRIYR